MRAFTPACLLCLVELGSMWGLLANAASSSSSATKPNVLMVVLDDVGWQDVGFHDDTFHTPHMNLMASEGIELTAFYASPECTPARSQLMTGRYNYKTGMQDSVIRSTEPRGLPLDEDILPQKLLEAGYQTAMVGKWHLGFHMEEYTPSNRGFERHYGIYCGGGDHFTHLSKSLSAEARESDGNLDQRYYMGPNLVEDGKISDDNGLTSMHSSELYTLKTLEYLDDMVGTDDPWFIYLSFQAVHTPVEVAETWYTDTTCSTITAVTGEEEFPLADDDMSWIDRKKICGMMAQVDHGLGRIRSFLEDAGEWDNTVVLLFSDNGGVAAAGSLNLPYRGEKGQYWEGGVRVPAIIAGGYTQSSLTAGLGSAYEYKHMVHITDMHATALKLAGYEDGYASPPLSQPQLATLSERGTGELGRGGGGKRKSKARSGSNAPTKEGYGVAAMLGRPASVAYSTTTGPIGTAGSSSIYARSASTTATSSSSPSDASDSTDSSTVSSSDDLDGVDMWDAWTSTGESARNTIIVNVNSALFAFSGCVRHGKYKLMRNPEPDESRIWSKVRTALVDYGFWVPQAVLAKLASEAHAELHLDNGGHMYLFDIEANPYEKTTCNDGGKHPSCSNLFHHPSYSDMREELVAIMEQAQEDSIHSTFQWQDDGPLSDPYNFGGWLPWLDEDGYPRVRYGGAYVTTSEAEITGAQYTQGQPPRRAPKKRSKIASLSSLPPFGARGAINDFRVPNGTRDGAPREEVVPLPVATVEDVLAAAAAASSAAERAASVAATAVAASEAAAKEAAEAESAAVVATSKRGHTAFLRAGGVGARPFHNYEGDSGDDRSREHNANGLAGQPRPAADLTKVGPAISVKSTSAAYSVVEVCGVILGGMLGVALAIVVVSAIRGGAKHDYTTVGS